MSTPIEKIFEDVQLHVKFTQAGSRSNIVTYDPTDPKPENISTAFGKLSTWFNALVPTGGSSGQFLGWSSDGVAQWVNNPNVDTKVTQQSTSSQKYRPILFGYTEATSPSGLTTTVTNKTFVTSKFYVKPSTGEMFIDGTLQVSNSSYGPLTIKRANDTYHWAGIKFADNDGVFGSIAMGAVDGVLKRYNSDESSSFMILDTGNTSVTTTGTGNAITSLSFSNGVFTADTGNTSFLTEHPSVPLSADTTSKPPQLTHGGTFTAITSVTREGNGHVTKINTATYTLPNDTLMTQTNTTTSADYRVLLSGNANDTTETTTGRKSTNLKFNPSSGGLYSFGFLWTDITGQTLDINTLTLSDGTLHSRRFIEKTDGGATNITNIPVTGHPFLLEVDLIRWASTTDYITRQRFTNAANGTYSYVRYCTNGTWGNWTTRKYTDTNTKVTSAANHYTPATASGGDISESASGATAAWSIDVVKGVTLNTDGKGHVTGLSVTSGKIPANPVPSNNVTGNTAWTVADRILVTNAASGNVIKQSAYTIGATLNSGTTNQLAYYSGANAISATHDGTNTVDSLYFKTGTNAKSARQIILGIYGQTYGNDAAALISGTAGVFSYGDGGPQIDFNSSASGSQAGALIFTDHDSAATGASWHFVSNQADWNVTSKRFHARTSISIGTDLPNTSYNLYVNGTSQFTYSDFGQIHIVRSGSTWAAGIKFSNSNGLLGAIGMTGNVDTPLIRWKSDLVTAYTIIDTSLLNVTDSTNLGLDGGTNAFGYVSGLTKAAWNFQQTDGTIIRQYYNTNWKTEIFMDYRTGQMSTRGKNNGTWQDWRIHLDSGNYTSYTVTKTGSGASGTWGINITGNSANVTGTVAIAHGGTGATNRLAALRALTEENVGTSAQYFLTITDSWKNGGYTSVANAKTVLGLGSAAYVTQESLLRARSSVTTDGGATGWSQIGINQYNNAYPDGVTNKIYSYGAVVSMPAPSARFDLYYNHISSAADSITNGLQYRTGWNDDKKAWRMLIDNVNYTEYMPYKKPIKFQFNNGITNGYWAKLFSANYNNYNILEIDIVTYHGYDGNFRSKLHIRFTNAGFVPGESSIISHQNIAPGSLRITQDDTNTFSLWIRCDGTSSRFGYEILNISDESSVFFNGVTLTAARWSFPTTFTKSDTAPTNAVTATRYFALDNHTHNFKDPTVTQTADNSNNSDSYELLISNSANNTTETAGVRKSTRLRFNPSTGRVIMQGPLVIRATDGAGSYDEGIRINAGKNGFSSLSFGGGQDTITGTADGQFWVGTNSTNDSFKRKLYIAHASSTGSGTYFYASSATQGSPALKLGTSGTITSNNGDAVTGGVVYTALSNYLPLSGGTMSGVISSTYKSVTYVKSLTSSVITLSDEASSFGGWICGPTKNGRIAISSYQGSDDKLYFGYGERGRTTNSYVKAMTWDGPTNTLTADKFVGALQGNVTGNCSGSSGSCTGTAANANKINTNAGATDRPVYFSGGVPVQCNTPASGSWWKGVPLIGTDGVTEIGRIIDFHSTNTSNADYDLRLQYTGTATGKTVTLPGATGTVALLTKGSTSYWGIIDGDGATSDWIRTTTNGFIPASEVSLANGGDGALGTSYWAFKNAYIANIYGVTIYENGTSLASKYAAIGHAHGLLHSNLTQAATNGTTGGWSVIGIDPAVTGYVLKSIRINEHSPNWLSGNYGAGIAFGGYDTKGVISMNYHLPAITFAGGNHSSSKTEPVWYFKISGTSGSTYNLDNLYGKLYNAGTGCSWWNDRDNAVIRITTGDTQYRPLWTLLTATSGSWGMGNHTGDDLTFNFISKAVYDSKANPSTYAQIKFTNTGAITANGLTLSNSDYGPLSIIRTGHAYYAGIKFYNNGSTYLGSFGITTANGRFARFNTDEATGYEIIDRSVVRNNTTVGTLGWTSVSADTVIPTVNTIAYWNGAYSGTSSNLAYCKKGEFGTIITKNTEDYVPNHGNLKGTIGDDSPATDVKTFFMTSSVPTGTSSIGYNTGGNEYTLIFGKGVNPAGFGAVLRFGYYSSYPEVLRIKNGTWQSADWEKISAGKADIAENVSGTVAIAHGGTGATSRLAALKALTNENVGTSAQYFLTITDSWKNGGFTTVANAKTVLGMGTLASRSYVEITSITTVTANKKFTCTANTQTYKTFMVEFSYGSTSMVQWFTVTGSSAAYYPIFASMSTNAEAVLSVQCGVGASATITFQFSNGANSPVVERVVGFNFGG